MTDPLVNSQHLSKRAMMTGMWWILNAAAGMQVESSEGGEAVQKAL